MSEAKNKQHLEALRQRLYDRGGKGKGRTDHPLKKTKRTHTDAWTAPPERVVAREEKTETPAEDTTFAATEALSANTPKRNKKYRLYVLLAGIGCFFLAMLISSLYLFFGQNTISGENITVTIDGPFAVGGGDEVPLDIVIVNENSIAIESATLVLEYPPGTKAADESGRNLFTERFSLDAIASGERLSVPVTIRAFGEENDKKNINVVVEYRVEGSNATFFKEAEPLEFAISSAPAVVAVEAVRQISSGQEIEFTVAVRSNATAPLDDTLLRAIYPQGFELIVSEPNVIAGDDVWLLPTIPPGEETEVKIRGTMTGLQDEEKIFTFELGVADERDPQQLASVLTSTVHDVVIEAPFLDVAVKLNSQNGEVVAVPATKAVNGEIVLTNSLEDTLFDAEIKVSLSGVAYDDTTVKTNGFFDSVTDTITWIGAEHPDLVSLQPGESARFSFTLEPSLTTARTPEVIAVVDVEAERVRANQVPEVLTATVERIARVSSDVQLFTSAEHNNFVFTNSGPVPPVAEETTTYTIAMRLVNGTNDITDGVTTMKLPQGVEWLDTVTPGADMSFNSVTREVTWNAGSVAANAEIIESFQVALTPSKSLIDTIPTLVGAQQFRATDRFTNAVLRGGAGSIDTELAEAAGFPPNNGRVQP